TKKRLEEAKENEAEGKLREELVAKASENAEVDIPQAMVDTELDRMMKEFEQRLQMQGMNLELYFQFSGQDEDALKEQMKEDAAKRVKSNLTLEAIAAAENLQVSDEEVEEELSKMAEAYNMPIENIKQAIGSTEAMKEDLKVRKAIDFLVENR
ncbi:trigger factor, partial [Bacillus safensis]|nr:trigger factor [Bacillus safensis]